MLLKCAQIRINTPYWRTPLHVFMYIYIWKHTRTYVYIASLLSYICFWYSNYYLFAQYQCFLYWPRPFCTQPIRAGLAPPGADKQEALLCVLQPGKLTEPSMFRTGVLHLGVLLLGVLRQALGTSQLRLVTVVSVVLEVTPLSGLCC